MPPLLCEDDDAIAERSRANARKEAKQSAAGPSLSLLRELRRVAEQQQRTLETRRPADSAHAMTRLLMPGHANHMGNTFGGPLAAAHCCTLL